jgi:hypothetical protein
VTTPVPTVLRRVTSRRLAGWLAALVLVALAGGDLAADYIGDYRKAYQAIDRKRYAEAIPLLQSAIADRGEEGGTLTITGQWRRVYLPYFYLGVAYAETGQPDKALEAFTRSKHGPALTDGNEGESRKLEAYLKRPALLAAQARLDAERIAAQREKEQEDEKRRAEAERSRQAAAKPPDIGVAPSPQTDALATARGVPAQPEPPPAVASPRPAAVVDGARAFFAGRYRDAVVRLQRIDGEPAQWLLQARLFRAAARYALHVRSGDRAQLAAAIADVAECRRIDPSFAPGEAFSPKFRSLYRNPQQAPPGSTD